MYNPVYAEAMCLLVCRPSDWYKLSSSSQR